MLYLRFFVSWNSLKRRCILCIYTSCFPGVERGGTIWEDTTLMLHNLMDNLFESPARLRVTSIYFTGSCGWDLIWGPKNKTAMITTTKKEVFWLGWLVKFGSNFYSWGKTTRRQQGVWALKWVSLPERVRNWCICSTWIHTWAYHKEKISTRLFYIYRNWY